MTNAAAAALDDIETSALKKIVGLPSPGEPIRTQEFAGGNPMGKRDCVFRRKLVSVHPDAIVSTPSSLWNPLLENGAQGDVNVLLADEFWNHCLSLYSAANHAPS